MATWIQVICSIPIVYSFLVARWIARWQEGLKAMAMHLDTGIGSIPIVQPYFLDVTCLKSRTFAVFYSIWFTGIQRILIPLFRY